MRGFGAALVLAAVAGFGGTPAVAKDEVRFCGAASVADQLVARHQAAVEQATGTRIHLAVSNAGRGLVELVEGKCDAAMASAALETVVKAAKAAGKELDPATLQMHVAATDEVVFVVHKSNPVTSLTWEQLRDIHTGTTTNWKELGGKDLPIAVFTDAPASATRGLIKDAVLGGQDYSPQANAVEVTKISLLVGMMDGAIGGLGKGFVQGDGVKVVQSQKLERPLGFITLGPPSDSVRKVIDAYRAQGQK